MRPAACLLLSVTAAAAAASTADVYTSPTLWDTSAPVSRSHARTRSAPHNNTSIALRGARETERERAFSHDSRPRGTQKPRRRKLAVALLNASWDASDTGHPAIHARYR